MVGMSTVYEQLTAQHATQSQKYPAFRDGRAVFAVATDYAGSVAEDGFSGHVNHEVVKEMAAKVEDRLGKIIKETMFQIRLWASESKKDK